MKTAQHGKPGGIVRDYGSSKEDDERIKNKQPHKFVPIEDVADPGAPSVEIGSSGTIASEEHKLQFQELKEKQIKRLNQLQSNISFNDLYYLESSVLSGLVRLLSSKGRKDFRYRRMQDARASSNISSQKFVEQYGEKYIKAKDAYQSALTAQGISKDKVPQTEFIIGETSRAVVKKFGLERLSKTERDILLNVLTDIIDQRSQFSSPPKKSVKGRNIRPRVQAA